MHAYDTQHLPTDLKNWINARLLKPLLYFEGGWEKWWQSDFPAWLDTVNEEQFDFRREVRTGGITAAPVFAQIAEPVARYLDIRPVDSAGMVYYKKILDGAP